jgi:hypothetical protein
MFNPLNVYIMKKSSLIIGALIVSVSSFAQPKGLDDYGKELFTNRVNMSEWTKQIGAQKWYYIDEANALGRLQTLKEVKKILIEYDKCLESPDYDYSIGLDEVLYQDITKIVSLVSHEGFVTDYFYVVGEYGLNIVLNSSMSAITVYKLDRKAQKIHQENLSDEN